MFFSKLELIFVKNLLNSFAISLLVEMSLSPHFIWIGYLIDGRCLRITVFHVFLMSPLFSASNLLLYVFSLDLNIEVSLFLFILYDFGSILKNRNLLTCVS